MVLALGSVSGKEFSDTGIWKLEPIARCHLVTHPKPPNYFVLTLKQNEAAPLVDLLLLTLLEEAKKKKKAFRTWEDDGMRREWVCTFGSLAL